jgi:hypothetical protein
MLKLLSYQLLAKKLTNFWIGRLTTAQRQRKKGRWGKSLPWVAKQSMELRRVRLLTALASTSLAHAKDLRLNKLPVRPN